VKVGFVEKKEYKNSHKKNNK